MANSSYCPEDYHCVTQRSSPRRTPRSLRQHLSSSAQTVRGHLDWENNITPTNYIMNYKTFNVVLLVLLLMVVEKNGFKDDRFA